MMSFQLAMLTAMAGCLIGAWMAFRIGSEVRDVRLMACVGGAIGLVCLSNL